MFENVNLNVRKKQGNVGVARAIFEYTAKGYTVMVPFSDSDKYDLVIDNGDRLLKVQVKTTRYTDPKNPDKWKVQLATTGGNTLKNTRRPIKPGDFDVLFVLAADGSIWSIPFECVGGKSQIVVSSSRYDQYKLTTGCSSIW